MNEYIFTFAINHPLGNYVQPIIAPTMKQARNKMFEKYGNHWGFCYTLDRWREWEIEADAYGFSRNARLNILYVEEGEYDYERDI